MKLHCIMYKNIGISFFSHSMRYVAAYMLAVMGGIENPSVDDLKMIIGSVGIDSDNEKINLVISKLKGKNIEELVLKSKYFNQITSIFVTAYVFVCCIFSVFT